ncbi:MAG: tRNA lysidine(34) synthetase TilS [Dissulfurimicrobium sp.]|uniref:tRNA lysidine(34) synthetase TilS n=1 Tax=Dissulfurimicrobium sp. TaxID=2022436 RepID=UPI0040494FFA
MSVLKMAREAITSPILNAIQKEIVRRGLFGPGAGIVAAVSGGPDSICLLHVLYLLKDKWTLNIQVAHFDHNLRGEESKRDAHFVQETAGRLMLPFHLGTGDVRAYARQKGMCIQDAARVMRYGFLMRIKEETGCVYIATGHTADDQAQEVLLRLLRGSGLAGLSGIHWQRHDGVIRPLLGISRKDVLRHLEAFGLDFVEDSSNESPKYMRNRIRKDLIPFLAEEFNPAIVKTLNRTAELLSEEHQLLEDMAARAFGRVLITDDISGITLDVAKTSLEPAPIRRRIYRMALQKMEICNGSIRNAHLRAMDAIVMGHDPGGICPLPGMAVAERRYNRFILTKMAKKARSHAISAAQYPEYPVQITGPGSWLTPSGETQIELMITTAKEAFGSLGQRTIPRTLFVDADSITFPLELRTRRPGERFWPFGAKSPVSLKDFLIARKVPRSLRDKLPVLALGSEVIAVVGVEIAQPYRLKTSSLLALSIKLIFISGH